MKAILPENRVGSGTLAVAMTPMIDVVFLLLVFFLCTATFEQPEDDLAASLNVATATSGAGQEPTQREALDDLRVVGVRREGVTVWTVNEGRSVQAGRELTELLESLVAIDSTLPVTIEPGPEVPFADAVAAYDSARAAGLDRVLLSARAETE